MKWMMKGMIIAAMIGFSGQAQAASPAKIIRSMDADGDGKISRDEYCNTQAKARKTAGKPVNMAKLEKQFAGRDSNSDGFLTEDELVSEEK